jgi:uncharacterized protein YdaL
MSFLRNFLALICVSLLLASLPVANAESFLTRPATAKGADAKTLVIYSETRSPYSLANELTALKLQLRRVASQLDTVLAAKVDTNQLAAADYVVVFCPQPFPNFAPEILEALAHSVRPVLWVGYGADQMARLPEFKGQFDVAPFASDKRVETVNYLGRNWNLPLPVWLPAQLDDTNGSTNIIMTVPVAANGELATHPLCWRRGAVTFFTALPTSTATSALFSDLLLDFFGATAPASAVCLRIDGYHCHQDHLEFRHMVDYLHERGRPFVVGVVPAYWDPVTKKIQELDSQPEFVSALRYAQKNGGRLVLQGYVNARKSGTGQEPEFWDSTLDRPFADDSAEYVRERVYQGVRKLVKQGLFPIGWQTPFNAASHTDYEEIAKHFSTAIERVQLSDATGLENFGGTAVAQDDFGRRIVPENLGAVTGTTNALAAIQSRVEILTKLRGTVATVSFPAYLTEEKLIPAARLLEQTKLPFLDLAEGDNWVQLPDLILLTGKAQRTVTLKDALIRWKAYDLAGNLVDSETEPQSTTGERVFQRRGKGDYELFEIIEAQP